MMNRPSPLFALALLPAVAFALPASAAENRTGHGQARHDAIDGGTRRAVFIDPEAGTET
jgi:hypothetical protein